MLEIVLVLDVLLFVLVAGLYFRSGLATIYHPASFYLFFHGFLFVFRPILNYLYDYRAVYRFYEFTPDEATRVTVLLAADLGFLCFMSFATLRGNIPVSFTRKDSTQLQRQIFLVVSALCLPLALYSLKLSLDTKFSGVSTMAYDNVHHKPINTSGNGYLNDANQMLIPITVCLAWLYRFRPLSLLPFAAFAGSRMLIGGGRWTFLLSAAVLCLLYLKEKRRFLPSSSVLLIGALFLFAFVMVGQDRGARLRAIIDPSVKVEVAVGDPAPLEGLDFANQEFFEYIVRAVPDLTNSYDYFADNLILVTGPIPRVLWPGKPITSPIEFFQLSDYGNPNGITMSLPGEGWKELGFLGVMIWCSLWGYIYGSIYRWYFSSDQSVFKTAIYFIVLGVCINFYRDGYLATFVTFLAFTLLPIFLWKLGYLLVGKKSKRRLTLNRGLAKV